MMKRAALISGLFVALSSGAFAQGAGPNPYLFRPAPTKSQLLAQIRSNPIVLDRYCRHFQLSRDGVLEMVSGLHKVALDRDTEVEMWNVPMRTGILKSKTVILKKGTTVWVDGSGTPILKASCGNPLVRTDETAEPQLKPAISQPGSERQVTPPAKTQVEQMTDVEAVEPLLPALPETEFVVTPLPSGPISVTDTQPSRFEGGVFALLPSLLIGLRTGGSDNKIPEPATITLLAAGGALAIASAKRRSR